MRNRAWPLLMCVLAIACGSGDDESAPDFVYGPCDDGQCGEGASLQGSDGTCLCALDCHVGDECPQPATGDVEAVCMDLGDVVNNGYDGRCDLPCSADDACPDESRCAGGFCRYRGEIF